MRRDSPSAGVSRTVIFAFRLPELTAITTRDPLAGCTVRQIALWRCRRPPLKVTTYDVADIGCRSGWPWQVAAARVSVPQD